MSAPPNLPLLIEPEQLQPHVANFAILTVDLSDRASYAIGHVAGAIHFDYAELLRSEPPVTGLLPDETRLSEVFSRIGLTSERHVVAYDDEGNGRASRLLWTLAALGHTRVSLLNGGIRAWDVAKGSLEIQTNHPISSAYQAQLANLEVIADKGYILARLDDPDVVLLDTRTPAEFAGLVVRAARCGHIPGSINLNWTSTMDQQRQLRFQPDPVLRKLFEWRGVTPDKEIIVYCQNHHRSAHTFCVLRYLGYPRVRGYPGSWSEWGNDPSLPIAL